MSRFRSQQQVGVTFLWYWSLTRLHPIVLLLDAAGLVPFAVAGTHGRLRSAAQSILGSEVTMSAEENLQRMKTLDDAWNAQDWKVFK